MPNNDSSLEEQIKSTQIRSCLNCKHSRISETQGAIPINLDCIPLGYSLGSINNLKSLPYDVRAEQCNLYSRKQIDQ